jgi:hypothetical protein
MTSALHSHCPATCLPHDLDDLNASRLFPKSDDCKYVLLHVKTVTPKGRITEKLYSQSPCSIYVHIGRCSKHRLTMTTFRRHKYCRHARLRQSLLGLVSGRTWLRFPQGQLHATHTAPMNRLVKKQLVLWSGQSYSRPSNQRGSGGRDPYLWYSTSIG